MTREEKLAKAIVKAVLENLGDRRGIKSQLEAVRLDDEETWEELVESLETDVQKVLRKGIAK